MPVGAHREVHFTNSDNDVMRMCVFDAAASSPTAPKEDVPVLFCVHGAGMSGESFFRLATALQCHHTSASQAEEPLPQHITPGAPQVTAAPSPALPLTPPLARPPVPVAAHSSLHGQATVPGKLTDALDDGVEMDMSVVTYDLRCHGGSSFSGGEAGLTRSVLVKDFLEVLKHTQDVLFPKSRIFVMGHSLGGSVAAHGLAEASASVRSRVGGAILVDVVEETAKLSLKHMNDFLKRRPTHFPSVKDAERWFLQHGGMRSPEGASVSVPPLLKEAHGEWVWRTNLSLMEGVWEEWFTGLDQAFIGLAMPKMLCVANADRLDTPLTVAHMQGKFQFELIGNDSGHYVMDDATGVVAGKVRRFVKRIEVLSRRLIPGAKQAMVTTTVPPTRPQ